MSRHALTLSRADHRDLAPKWLARAMALGWRVAFMEPKRSLAQNDRLWELLGRVAKRMTLLYLRSAKLAPSPAPARVSDGVVRDV